PGGPEVRRAFDQTRQRFARYIVASGFKYQGRWNSMTDRLARAREFAIREEEPVVLPVCLVLETPAGAPKVPSVVPVPSPYRPEDPVRRLLIGRGGHREGDERGRHGEF